MGKIIACSSRESIRVVSEFTPEIKYLPVVTHNNNFHADEVFAIALLAEVYKDNHIVEVIRTRDPAILDTAINSNTIHAIDVGGSDWRDLNNFDHHQYIDKSKYPNSSFGLVVNKLVHISPRIPESIYYLSKEIDASDNGLNYNGPVFRFSTMTDVSFSEAIESFNPSWCEEPNYDERFVHAVEWARSVLRYFKVSPQIASLDGPKSIYSNPAWDNALLQIIRKNLAKKEQFKLDAYNQFKEAVYNYTTFYRTGAVVWLPQYVPFDEYLFEYEKYGDTKNEYLSLIYYPDLSDNVSVRILNKEKDSFLLRLDPPSEWLGLSGKKFQEVSGVEDAVFCHANGFIMSAKSKAGQKN